MLKSCFIDGRICPPLSFDMTLKDHGDEDEERRSVGDQTSGRNGASGTSGGDMAGDTGRKFGRDLIKPREAESVEEAELTFEEEWEEQEEEEAHDQKYHPDVYQSSGLHQDISESQVNRRRMVFDPGDTGRFSPSRHSRYQPYPYDSSQREIQSGREPTTSLKAQYTVEHLRGLHRELSEAETMRRWKTELDLKVSRQNVSTERDVSWKQTKLMPSSPNDLRRQTFTDGDRPSLGTLRREALTHDDFSGRADEHEDGVRKRRMDNQIYRVKPSEHSSDEDKVILPPSLRLDPHPLDNGGRRLVYRDHYNLGSLVRRECDNERVEGIGDANEWNIIPGYQNNPDGYLDDEAALRIDEEFIRRSRELQCSRETDRYGRMDRGKWQRQQQGTGGGGGRGGIETPLLLNHVTTEMMKMLPTKDKSVSRSPEGGIDSKETQRGNGERDFWTPRPLQSHVRMRCRLERLAMTSPGPAEDGPAMAEEFLFGYRKSFSSYSDRVDPDRGRGGYRERPYSDMDVDLLDGGRNGYRDHPDVAVLKMKIEEQMHQLSLLQKENKDKGRQSHGLGSGARRYKQMDMEFDDGDDPADQRPLHDQPRYIVDAYSRHFEIDIEGDMDTGHIESENPFPGVNHDDEIVEVKVGGEDEKQLENDDNDPVAAVAIGRAKNSVSRQQSPHRRERFESYLTQQRRAKYRRMSKRRRARRKMSKNRLSALDQERHPGLIPTSVSADDQNWTDRSATPSERYFSEGAEQGASDWSHGLLPSTFSPLWRSHDSLGSFEVAVSYHADIDSSSISSGGLSDTINEISTDDNVTGSSSRNSFESAKNLEIFSDNIQFEDYELDGLGKNDGYVSDSKVKVPRYLKTGNSYVQSRRMSSNDTRLLNDSDPMNKVELPKGGGGGASGRNAPPPPNWQRSLDRLAARQRQRANLGLVRTDRLQDGKEQLDGKGLPLRGKATTPTGRMQGGFGYRKPAGYSSKSGLSPAGLAAQKSIKDTIDKLSSKSSKSEAGKKTSPSGLSKKTSPGSGSQSRLKASLGKSPPSSVWLKQNGATEGKTRVSGGGSKPGSKKTSPIKMGVSQNASGIAEKSDQSRDPNSLKGLFARKGSDQSRMLKKDTIISNPLAMDKGHGTPGSMSETDTSSLSKHRTSTAEGYGRLQLDESRFSGYVSDSYTTSKGLGGYTPMGFRHDRYRTGGGGGGHSFLKKGPESASMESLESNTSSAYSVASHAASEMVGPTYGSGLSSSISRSTSLRSSLSDRTYKPPLSLLEKSAGQVDWLNGSYSQRGSDRSSVQLSPTESTTSHPPMNFFPMASMGTQGTQPPNLSRHLRNGSLSMDERQRAALSICALLNEGNEELHGSTMSLQSAPSFYNSMTPTAFPTGRPGERSAAEIERLKRDLEREQDRVSTLSRDLSANAHVVAVFEQSLTGMTSRLQQLTCSTEQKDTELQDLREKIEQLKIAHTEGRNGSLRSNGTDLLRKHSIGSKDQILGETRLSRQTSCESMSSLASMTSMSSAGSAMTDTETLDSKNKKKKKNWIRSSFRSAFGRKKKASGTTTDVEDLDNSMTFVNDSLLDATPPPSQMKQSASTSAIYDSEQSEETITTLRRQLRDKEGKLTDIKLEALTSQHQLDQMQEVMNKMKNEMMVLKQENERLQRQVHTRKDNSSLNSLNSTGSSKRLSRDSLDRHRLSLNSDHGSGSLDILIDDNSGMTSNSQRIVVTVVMGNTSSSEGDKEASNGKLTEVMIGTIGISSKTNWDALDSVVRRIFKEYVLRIDPMTNLGLSAESVHHYIVGEISRTKDADPPELLPCGYLVGDKTSITIALKDYKNNSCDALVFETLVPKPILQRYISLLLEHKRIILCGPSGTGKTYLAQKLAEHIVQRSGKEPNEGNIATFNVDHKSGKDLRQYLTHIADQCETNALDLPTVIILDNLHHAGSLGEIFTGFLSYKYHKCPYIIGTMNQATCQSTNLQLHHNFRWVLCANHMEPVKGFLGRYLRRKLIETEVKHNTRNNDLNKVIEWMPKVWQHLNKFLETHNSSDVTIGPRLFLQCPIDLPGSQVWFTDLWNYSIVPYLLEAVREGLQLYGRKASWEDPSDWVFESYPWTSSGSQETWPSLLKLRPEDIGFDGYKVQGTNSKSTKPQGEVEGDPLFDMLMRLQEATNFSNPQSCDSDTNSLDSCGNSTEDLLVESVI